jgi:hypothetical protein
LPNPIDPRFAFHPQLRDVFDGPGQYQAILSARGRYIKQPHAFKLFTPRLPLFKTRKGTAGHKFPSSIRHLQS